MLRFLRSALLHVVFLIPLRLLASMVGLSLMIVFLVAGAVFVGTLLKHARQSGFEKLSTFLGTASLFGGVLTGYTFYLVGLEYLYGWLMFPILATAGLLFLARTFAGDEQIPYVAAALGVLLTETVGLTIFFSQWGRAWAPLTILILSWVYGERKEWKVSAAARRQYQRKYKTAT